MTLGALRFGVNPIRWRKLGVSPDLPIVTSYFTDAFYMREAFELVRSCLAVGIDYDVRQVPDLRDWRKNTSYKPEFLRGVSEEYPTRSILWLDADARLRQSPCLLPELKGCGVAYHVLGKQSLSGTVLLSPGPGRKSFLDAWVNECQGNTNLVDQECMARAARGSGVTPTVLPKEYCWIYDFNGTGRGVPVNQVDPVNFPEVVIEHMQASRIARDASVRR